MFTGYSRHPTVKWAQRSDKLYLTVELPDAKDVKLKLEPEGRFIFSATKDDIPYDVDIDLFDKIKVEVWWHRCQRLSSTLPHSVNQVTEMTLILQDSKFNVGVRSIVYVIAKAEKKWWASLIKNGGKPPMFVKVDWDRWVDEEDENGRVLLLSQVSSLFFFPFSFVDKTFSAML